MCRAKPRKLLLQRGVPEPVAFVTIKILAARPHNTKKQSTCLRKLNTFAVHFLSHPPFPKKQTSFIVRDKW